MSWDHTSTGEDGTVTVTCKPGYLQIVTQDTDGKVVGDVLLTHPDEIDGFAQAVAWMTPSALRTHTDAGWESVIRLAPTDA